MTDLPHLTPDSCILNQKEYSTAMEQDSGPSEPKSKTPDPKISSKNPATDPLQKLMVEEQKQKACCKKLHSRGKHSPKKVKPRKKLQDSDTSSETSSQSSSSSQSEDSESSSSDTESGSESESKSASTTESECRKKSHRKSKNRSKKSNTEGKKSKGRRGKHQTSSEETSSSSSESGSEDEPPRSKRKVAKKVRDRKKSRAHASSDSEVEIVYDRDPIPIRSRGRHPEPIRSRYRSPVRRRRRYDDDGDYLSPVRDNLLDDLNMLHDPIRHRNTKSARIIDPVPPLHIPQVVKRVKGRAAPPNDTILDFDDLLSTNKSVKVKAAKPRKTMKKGTKIAYKRVDQLWDATIHNYKLTATVKETGQEEWDQYIFVVRRRFDWEHKYLETYVDIKSKQLKECLQHVLAGVKGISLVHQTPSLDPNTLFLYVEDFRQYVQQLKGLSKSASKSKERKSAGIKAKHLAVLIKYVDKDYKDIKKSLDAMLKNKTITFDLLWALFKPGTIAYTGTYGDAEEPRAFRIEQAQKQSNFMRGVYYNIEGQYLDYDGKTFGMGTLVAEIPMFAGARKITSLECFPLDYHNDVDKLRTHLIDRGKKFVSLQGMNYKYHDGMAYSKRKRQILKINVTGRIMVDPAIHRRINPNYQVGAMKPKGDNDLGGLLDDDNDSCCSGGSSGPERTKRLVTPPSSTDEPRKEVKRYRVVKDEEGKTTLIPVDAGQEAEASKQQAKLTEPKTEVGDSFTEEELLISSPVVLGFAFSEKLWLEFTVSNISEVVFNEDAFDSLVLPDNQKSIVKALVSSHAFHPSRNIDDIITGKGKGLVAVLHGPPGTGKTLTAEGIADLLKCPLYMVSAGDLGTDSRTLEKELQNILDIAHSWGAILLLDEADVFLERRSVQDIHRNALVSIFLRLLEYFQGILFLTTNRVLSFDEAFISRIHLSLRYEELNSKARKTIWKLFINKVKSSEGLEVMEMTESDYTDLAKHGVNGRQIKNIVRAAQALATYESKPLAMAHIKRVMDVAESFEIDLKGGTGYNDAMRSYT